MIVRIGLGLGFLFLWLALGWWLHRRGWLTEARASRLVRLVVTGLSPLVLCFTFWRMDLRHLAPWLLPFLGILISASTLLPAVLYARRAGLSGPQTGSFLTCAFFSNVGYLGAFTAFALFGEAGYALCMLYLVFFTPSFYTLGFGIAMQYGQARTTAFSSAYANERLRLFPFLGMLAGAALSLARVPRPLPLQWLNCALIPADTALYLVAVGSQLTIASPRPWLRACLAMSGIKFLYTPAVAWGLVSLFHIEGLPRTIVLLEASTAVAVSPMVLPLLFGLDRKLANALWLFTTLVAIPWFVLVLPALLPRL